MAKAGYGCPFHGPCSIHCRRNVIGSGSRFQGKRPCDGRCYNGASTCLYGVACNG